MAHRKPASQSLLLLRHKSFFFTKQSISYLQDSGAIDLDDLISIVFLICETSQFPKMYENLISYLKLTNFPVTINFFDIFNEFPNWEHMLIEALQRLNNKKALFLLRVDPSAPSADHQAYCLNGSRVLLYRIMEELKETEGISLIKFMMDHGAPSTPTYLPHLELYFMFWHIKGFLNVDNQEGFEHVADALRYLKKPNLAYTLGYCPTQFYVKSLFDDDFPIEMYPIKDERNPGLCIIINQVRYGGKETDRDSSLVDVGKLERLLTKFNFKVVTLEDVGSREFCESIRSNVSEHFSENYSVFMLVVMAHGKLDYIMCPPSNTEETSDRTFVLSLRARQMVLEGKRVRTRDDTVCVKSIENCICRCSVLRGKPKILIVNACRGDKWFTTKTKFQMADEITSNDEIESMVDIITCYSALPDFVSFRDKQKGALFINVFCDVLSERPDIEIYELFTLINARLMRPTPDLSAVFQKDQRGDLHKLASPFEFTSSLTKKLYLNLPNNHNKSCHNDTIQELVL